jgi:TonB-linked SusC/RagA family outer membrane protein
MLWDTIRYTDWQKLLTGRNANLSDLSVSISGGTKYTRFLLSSGIYSEATVYSKDMSYLRNTINFAADHRSKNDKFKIGLYANYSADNNQLFNPAFSGEMLPPNTAKPYDEHKNFVWEDGGEPIGNAMAERLKRYTIKKHHLVVNVSPSYEFFSGFRIRANIGLTGIDVFENSIIPIAAQNPDADSAITGSSSFATGKYKSIMIDPVAEYTWHTTKSDLILLGGYSYQYAHSNTSSVNGFGYTSDMALRFIDNAPYKAASTPDHNHYKYGAFFTQLNYKFRQKYIVDLTFRRDGSSKFSPERRFGNFWAAGGAWIFSNEKFLRPLGSVLRYGKLRSSIGVTGNDKIANYKYLDTWSPPPGGPYQGIPGLSPDALYNPAYSWETCRKIEMGLDLELTPADIALSVVYFTNRSANQLVKYNLASQTGFNSILKNIDAAIRNRGWEFTLDASLLNKGDFQLSAGLNLTLPENTLLRFDKLATSSYYGTYVIGQSVNVLNRLRSDGVNPKTGIFMLRDKDGNGTYNAADYEVIGRLDPSCYGSIRLGLTWKNLSLTVFGDFKKQMAPNYLHTIYLNNILPGTAYNQSVEVLDRWQKPGDETEYPKYSTLTGSAVHADRKLVINSDRAYTDASFFKLRNLYCYYKINSPLLSRIKVGNMKIYCKAQNLFTVTKYKGGDPETASPLSLPSLRTITAGLQATF